MSSQGRTAWGRQPTRICICRYFIRELEFVNADLIAKGLSPYDPDSVAMEKTGRLAIRDVKQFEKLAAEAGMEV